MNNMNNRVFILPLAMIILLLTLCACAHINRSPEQPAAPSGTPAQNEATTPPPDTQPATQAQLGLSDGAQGETGESGASAAISGEVIISFDYERIPGSASNQYAVWIEDMDGNLIKTLYASQWTARGGYRTRPDSIALWVEKSNLASMSDYEVDAISGATPSAGAQSYTWGLTDANDNAVPPGEYRFFVEGTLRWKNYVLYSGIITISDTPMTALADAEFFYEASDRYDALTVESPENTMIGPVTASFMPSAGG